MGLLLAALAAAPPAEARFGLAVPPSSSPTRDILLTEARIHLARGRDQEAIYALNRALHEHPDHLPVVWKLADLYYEHRDYKRAIGLLKGYLDRSSRQRNFYYALALCYHKTGKLRDALGAYARAVQIDPGHLKARVRIAQVRIRQGLPYDAAKILRKALEINPEYLPALEELKVANRLIEGDGRNVYRKRNVVVLFHDHKQFQSVDRAFPVIDKFRKRLEADLQYHLPVLWIRVENKVRRFQNPPALYDAPEDTVRVEARVLEEGDYEPLLHEIAMLYLDRMAGRKVPNWLAQGLVLNFLKPRFLEAVSLRTTRAFPVHLRRDDFVQRRYLPFTELEDEKQKVELGKAFVVVRYLLETYGWVGMRKMLQAFRQGESSFWKAAWAHLRLERNVFERRLSMYAIKGYYFSTVDNTTHP